MKVFKLPDLGEGLAEAEIRQWYVEPGAQVKTGEPLVAVETAKAIVEIPAPWDGVIEKRFAETEDILQVGQPLVAYVAKEDEKASPPGKEDKGSVVGEVATGSARLRERAEETSRQRGVGVRATPAVRALAHKLSVDLSMVTPSGPDGSITSRDVERVAKILAQAGPMEMLRGPRRAMARTMAQAHAEVADVTVTEDADIGDWPANSDITVRLIRAMVAACRVEPALNAWYDTHAMGRRVLPQIDLGIAVDTADGLFVPVLRNVTKRSVEDLRAGLDRLKEDVRARKIPAEELRGYTIILSNYGQIGGRYSDPIVVPPTVAILGAGRVRDQVVAKNGSAVVRPILPLSLTFDHRVVTGGEATRFLMAVIEDLAQAQ